MPRAHQKRGAGRWSQFSAFGPRSIGFLSAHSLYATIRWSSSYFDTHTDNQQPSDDHDVATVAPEHPDQSESPRDDDKPQGKFKARVECLRNKFRRRPSVQWNTIINLGVAVTVAIGSVVAILSLNSLNRSVDEMVKQTPEIMRSTKAAEEAAAAAKEAATAAKIQADASKVQADAAVLQAAAAVASNTFAKEEASATTLQALAAARANQLAEQSRLDNITTFKQENRAELRHRHRLLAEPDDKGAFRVALPMRNERPTDATNIRIVVLFGVGLGQTASFPESEWAKNAFNGTISTVFARTTTGRNYNLTPTLDAALLKRYNGGENLFILTRLRYCDVFKEAHWINVCAYRARNRGNDGFSFCGIATGEGDDAADKQECQGQPRDQP